MSEHDILANQKLILENQHSLPLIVKNQEKIFENQQKILENQEKILAMLQK